ncbi:hypothetical protein MBLNU13_g07130t1 [Cladosporium sp. NU13]
MVFHAESKRRNREKPQTEAHTTFLDLPDELVLAILERTDGISEVLRLRQTSKVFVPACSSIIRKDLKTLYIHPRQISVEQGIELCKTDLASSIEEICFINKIRWDMIPVPAHFDKRFGHSWPSLGLHERKNELNLGFTAYYEELLTALATLPSAKTLSFKNTCDGPGFNMVSEKTIYNWAFTVIKTARTWDAMAESRALSSFQKAEAKLYGMPKVKPMRNGFNFSDLDAVVAALGRITITTLKLTEELPYADERSLATASLNYLTHVELLVHLGWQKSAWQRFCHELLRHAAPTLQTLNLTFKHNPATAWRRKAETSLATIVRDIDFPKLRSLELRALELPEQLPYVPQIVDFMAFLSRCTALKFFRTSRVFPTLQHILILIDPDDYPSMDRILAGFEGEVRALEESEKKTRAWEMNV